jgi:hypothetical protein
MPEYPVTWMDYRLSTGSEFSVAICANEGRVCDMFLKGDVDRRSSAHQVNVEGQECSRSHRCLALDCSLNKTPKNVVIQMLGMNEDEALDEETAKIWGTDSTVDGLIKFIKNVESKLIWGESGEA